MAANQVQIPVIQTQTQAITQIQQNTNKVLRNINNQATSLQTEVSQIQGLGDVIFSPLTLTQFQTIHGTSWIEANGQSSVSTAYETLTGNKTVPTITISGATAFIKVN
jgi:hypothetical protein